MVPKSGWGGAWICSLWIIAIALSVHQPLCFVFVMPLPSTRPGSNGHVRLFNGRGRLFTNVIYCETELPATSNTLSSSGLRAIPHWWRHQPEPVFASVHQGLQQRVGKQLLRWAPTRDRTLMEIAASSCCSGVKYSGKAVVVWCKERV